MVGDAWLEAGVVLGLAILSSVLAYGKSTARSDAKLKEIDRILQERKDQDEIARRERKEQIDKEFKERREWVDREFRALRHEFTRFETLITEFRGSLATLYNDRAEIKIDVASNYLSKPEFYAALERTSLQWNAYQVNIDARLSRLEDKLK